MEKDDIAELKKAILELSKRIEKLESAILSQKTEYISLEQKSGIEPFFVKGHDMPIVVTKPRDPIRGRFLTLKVLYEKNKPMLVEEIYKETGRSRALEVGYLNDLARDGWVRKERVQIGGRERIKYEITDIGKKIIERLIK